MTVSTPPTHEEIVTFASRILADTYNHGKKSYTTEKVAGLIAHSVESHKNDLGHLAHDVADIVYDVYHSNLRNAILASQNIFTAIGMPAQAERLGFTF